MARKKQTEAIVGPAPQAVPVPVPAAIEVYKPASIQFAVQRLESVRRFITRALNTGYQRELKKIGKRAPTELEKKKLKSLEIDFGTIPGVNKKFLLQPGAEKLCLWLHVRPVYETSVEAIPDKAGHIDVVSRCRLFAVGSSEEVYSGPMASCSSMESNFRYRWVKMDPQPTREWSFGEGKMAKALGTHKCYPVYKDNVKTGDWEWSQRADNPNIYDERNKVRQMAEKRALVKAIRNFGAMSEIFTEDPSEWVLEDESNTPEGTPEPQGRVVREQQPEPMSKEGGASPSAAPPTTSDGLVEIHWIPETADVALIPVLPAAFAELIKQWTFWNDVRKCLFCAAANVPDIAELAKARGYQFVEIDDSKKPAIPASAAPHKPGLPDVGMVTNIRKEKGRTKGAAYMMVLYAGVWVYCYHPTMFPHLNEAVGKKCQFVFSQTALPKIEAILRIGDKQFEDGLPVIDVNSPRERTLT